MKAAQNVNLKRIPDESCESWEERVFWKCDALLSKGYPYILIFFALYLIAHIIACFI